MNDIKQLTKRIIDFRDARDWKQFHNSKDVAISLVLEANEVMEHFQWKSETEIEEYTSSHNEDIADELADVMYWVLLLSHDLNINIAAALAAKMEKNEKKYQVEKSRGNHKKYTELK